jgi:hypothetical protein
MFCRRAAFAITKGSPTLTVSTVARSRVRMKWIHWAFDVRATRTSSAETAR